MQRAHRRHQPDRPAVAAGGGERLAQLEPWSSGDVHRCSLGGVDAGALGERLVEVGELRGGLAKRLQMPLDRRLVAAGDRTGERAGAALRPVGGGAQDERREQLAGVLDPGPLEQLDRRLLRARRGSWRRSRRRRGRRRGRRRRPRTGASRGARRARGRSRARPRRSRRSRAGQPVRSLSPSGTVCSGWIENGAAARLAERLERGEGRGAARVAGEAEPRHRPRRSPPPPQRSPRRARRGAPRRRPRRPRRRPGVPRAARSARRRSAAVAIEEPTRPAPTIASTWRAASGAVALLVGRSRSSSLIEIPDGGGWFRWLAGCPASSTPSRVAACAEC